MLCISIRVVCYTSKLLPPCLVKTKESTDLPLPTSVDANTCTVYATKGSEFIEHCPHNIQESDIIHNNEFVDYLPISVTITSRVSRTSICAEKLKLVRILNTMTS